MPIALNMTQVNFRYGDYLLREGEVPRGLFLIKSGLCNVSRIVISSRKQCYFNDTKCKRRQREEKHPLLNNYDAENTLLNNVKLTTKVSQNSRVYVDSQGKQVKDQIQFENLVSFTESLPVTLYR